MTIERIGGADALLVSIVDPSGREIETWTLPAAERSSLLRRWVTASSMPRPYSALSSKRELAHAGPWPSSLTV